MNSAPLCAPRIGAFLLLAVLTVSRLSAEPLPLKRAVDLALAHIVVDWQLAAGP